MDDRSSRSTRTPTTEAGAALKLLSETFALWDPTPDAFFIDYFGPLHRAKSNGETVPGERHVADSIPHNLLHQSPKLYSLFQTAAAYSVAAITSENEGRRDEAWTYAIDAMHWATTLSGAMGFNESLIEDLATKLRVMRHASSVGGQKSAATRRLKAKVDPLALSQERDRLISLGTERRNVAGMLAQRFGCTAGYIRAALKKSDAEPT